MPVAAFGKTGRRPFTMKSPFSHQPSFKRKYSNPVVKPLWLRTSDWCEANKIAPSFPIKFLNFGSTIIYDIPWNRMNYATYNYGSRKVEIEVSGYNNAEILFNALPCFLSDLSSNEDEGCTILFKWSTSLPFRLRSFTVVPDGSADSPYWYPPDWRFIWTNTKWCSLKLIAKLVQSDYKSAVHIKQIAW